MSVEFIAHDWCGSMQQYGRYTHMPSGDTLVCKAWMGQVDWDKAQLEYFQKYSNITVHECPGQYTSDGALMGTVEEICARLTNRLER